MKTAAGWEIVFTGERGKPFLVAFRRADGILRAVETCLSIREAEERVSWHCAQEQEVGVAP